MTTGSEVYGKIRKELEKGKAPAAHLRLVGKRVRLGLDFGVKYLFVV